MCKEQHQSQTQDFCGCGVAEALPFFKPAGLTVLIFLFLFFIPFICSSVIYAYVFCNYEGKLPYRSSAQMSCQEEVDDSFVAG
jgi:hypothetical protein